MNHALKSLYIPFTIHIDPMERLLLINFEKDPDSTYIGFEPQVFDDQINGKGILIIGWRKDGKVDVYHQASLKLDSAKYDITGKGLSNMVIRELLGSYFNVEKTGVKAFIEFLDIHGREIKLVINEENSSKRKPFGLLAPMGNAAENPSALPLILLHDFYFVRREKTKIIISIANRLHEPDKLPLPLDWTFMYFARYSPDPLIVTLNPAFEGFLLPLNTKEKIVPHEEPEVELDNDKSGSHIKKIQKSHGSHTVKLLFEPSFPDISIMEEQSVEEGKFIVSGHSSTGRVEGKYRISKSNGIVEIIMVPSGGWIPNEKKWSLKFLYYVAKIFKKWPTTYEWKAELKLKEGKFFMKSAWTRTDRRLKSSK
ncbi:MAG: hypothetical protein ACK4ND_17970 [Cytophagaceae bacterium]